MAVFRAVARMRPTNTVRGTLMAMKMTTLSMARWNAGSARAVV